LSCDRAAITFDISHWGRACELIREIISVKQHNPCDASGQQAQDHEFHDQRQSTVDSHGAPVFGPRAVTVTVTRTAERPPSWSR
jgi:hypothetical protein